MKKSQKRSIKDRSHSSRPVWLHYHSCHLFYSSIPALLTAACFSTFELLSPTIAVTILTLLLYTSTSLIAIACHLQKRYFSHFQLLIHFYTPLDQLSNFFFFNL